MRRGPSLGDGASGDWWRRGGGGAAPLSESAAGGLQSASAAAADGESGQQASGGTPSHADSRPAVFTAAMALIISHTLACLGAPRRRASRQH